MPQALTIVLTALVASLVLLLEWRSARRKQRREARERLHDPQRLDVVLWGDRASGAEDIVAVMAWSEGLRHELWNTNPVDTERLLELPVTVAGVALRLRAPLHPVFSTDRLRDCVSSAADLTVLVVSSMEEARWRSSERRDLTVLNATSPESLPPKRPPGIDEVVSIRGTRPRFHGADDARRLLRRIADMLRARIEAKVSG